DRKNAAAFLTDRGFKTAPATLAKLACLGGGPGFRSFGRKPLYLAAGLLAWAEARTTRPPRPTSATAGPRARHRESHRGRVRRRRFRRSARNGCPRSLAPKALHSLLAGSAFNGPTGATVTHPLLLFDAST